MIYTMEFNIQQMERKVRRAEGDRTDEEKEILNKKIDQLQTQLDEVNAKYNLLNTQLKRSQEDLRHCKRRLDNLQRQRDNVLTNIEELNMYNESASHQLKALVKEREDVMVEESILRLELRKMRGFLNSRADEVYSLESRQVQLELALQERNKDINIHKDLLRVQIKNAEEERHSAAAELRERVGKVEKLKKRYEILMTQFAPEDDEEEHTQAYYVIKAAQKREELQKEGDSLDANIRRAEKEIKALENTLKMMNDRNEDFRMNLYQAELDSKDVQHKEMLDAEFRKIMDSFKSKRNHIQELQQQLSTLEQRLSSETGQETQHIQQLQLMQAKVQTTQRDIQDQTQKKQRALNAVQRYVKILRSQTADKTPEEMDILLRNLKDIGTIVLTELNKLMIHEADLVVPIKTLMAQIGIAQPSRVVSRASSRQSNVSQLSSRASSRQSMAVTKVPSAPRLSRDPAVPPLPAPTSRQGSQANVTGSQHKIPSVANINGALIHVRCSWVATAAIEQTGILIFCP
ncbi:hypothetical protein EDD86DRAFT_138178 [Gorgonomyces haynaldii]|nr:hypothetical protein EDD86DRAFT_138178 [Gorgonomyces haynaldii]